MGKIDRLARCVDDQIEVIGAPRDHKIVNDTARIGW